MEKELSRGDTRYTVRWLQAGQPRAYADSFYEFILTIEWVPIFTNFPVDFFPRDFSESIVLNYAKAIHYFYLPEDNPAWHYPILREKEKLGPGKWRFKIVEEFTD